MEYTIRKRNMPISTLIKNYLNKKSGKVVVSRREIQLRFDYLDWKDQKKILMSFLQAGIADRKWASYKLLSYWDKSFEPIMEDLWLKYKERELSWPIIRFFPIDYVKRNMNSLGAGHNYQDICIRLYGVKGFEMDESKLNEVELLNVYTKTGQRLANTKAMELLMAIVEKICTDKYEFRGFSWSYALNSKITPITETYMIRKALSLLEDGNKAKVVEEFKRWSESVLHDEEFNSQIMRVNDNFDISFIENNIRVSKRCYLKHLKDSKIQVFLSALEEYEKQKESFMDMQEENSSVQSLVDTFTLDVDIPVPF